MNQQIQQLRKDLADRLIKKMDEGHDWIMPWLSSRPINAVTRRQYHGVNILYLLLAAEEKGYKDPRWCTYYAAQQAGWQVRHGEKATAIEFWHLVEEEVDTKETGEKETIQVWRGRRHSVFNAEQIDGIPQMEEINQDFNQDYDELANDLIASSECPVIEDSEARAYYRPSADIIHMPNRETFNSSAGFVSTLLHEMGHSTGHPKRLGRDHIVKMAKGEPLTEYVPALQESGLYRYYCQNRLEPGALPHGIEIENMNPFDERQNIEADEAEKGTRAWGYIETKAPLDPDIVKQFDMVPAKGSYKAIKMDQNEIDSYPAEELVAEFASAFLENELNVKEHHQDEQHAAYLQSWGEDLKKDPNKLFDAVKAADKAADRVLDAYNKHIEKKKETAEAEEKALPAEKEPVKIVLKASDQPMVTITFTEDPELKHGATYSLFEANSLLSNRDKECKGMQGYYKTGFRIDYLMGESGTYEGRYDIGSEGVTLMEHIRSYNKELFDSSLYRESIKKKVAPEDVDRYIADEKARFDTLIKFFAYHHNLSKIDIEAQKGLEVVERHIQQGESPEPLADRKAYYEALRQFVVDSRIALAKNEELLEQPKLEDFRKKEPEPVQENASAKDETEKLADRLQDFFKTSLHQETEAETYLALLKENDVDSIIVTLKKLESRSGGEQKEKIQELIQDVQKQIQVEIQYRCPEQSIVGFMDSMKVQLPNWDKLNEMYDSFIESGDDLNPISIQEVNAMRQARDLWLSNIKSRKIGTTQINLQGPIDDPDVAAGLQVAIDTNRELLQFRFARDYVIGREYGVFDPSKMMDIYSEHQSDEKTIERKLLFESLKSDNKVYAMEEIYKTKTIKPYMIPHLHKAVTENPDISFERFNRLCDLTEPSKIYAPDSDDKKKSNKGSWLKKVKAEAGEQPTNDEKKSR